MRLSRKQCCRVHDVELDVVAAHGEVAANEASQLHQVLVAFEQAGQKALVQQRATRFDVVEFGQRLDDRRRSVRVAAVRRRSSVRNRFSGDSSVGRGAQHFAKIDVASGGEHVQVVGFALDVRLAVDGLQQVVVHTNCDAVGIVVVVAEKRCAVDDGLTQNLLFLKITCNRVQNAFHREGLVFENVLLERGKAVGNGAQSGALNVAGVVAWAAVVIILAFFDAILDDHRQERRGSIFGKHAVDVVAHLYLKVDNVIQLSVERVVEVLEGFERKRVAALHPGYFASYRVDAVVERHFQNLGHIQVTREQIRFLAERADFDATAATAFTGVLQRFSLIQ